jgi:hypothetical protein
MFTKTQWLSILFDWQRGALREGIPKWNLGTRNNQTKSFHSTLERRGMHDLRFASLLRFPRWSGGNEKMALKRSWEREI